MFVFVIDGADYAYLLGLYLGDGSMSSANWQLKVTLDARYPGIVVNDFEILEVQSTHTTKVRAALDLKGWEEVDIFAH